MQETKELFILSPFEMPDVKLALETIKAGAFPILHLGQNEQKAGQELELLSRKTDEPFGICISSELVNKVKIPRNVTKILLPFKTKIAADKKIELLYQVHSFEEAEEAIKNNLQSIVIKGNEGAGKVAGESSFVLFQGLIKKYPDTKTNIYIQGGAGIHSSSAFMALGAKGIIFDSQIAMFSECSAPKEIKDICAKLSGNETTVIDSFRVLRRNNSPALPIQATINDLNPYLGGFDISKNYLPMGQDIALAADFVEKYKKLKNFVYSFQEAIYGHLQQARKLNVISENSKLAQDLGIKYPIAQGPMARVSDVPEFAKKVSDGGALAFLALSLMRGKSAHKLLDDTAKLIGDKTWGVGILGFTPQQLRDEQTKYILEVKPPVVLIAGGRPSLAKPFEKEGIKVFLHVPSVALLDMFIKEGARNFIFEGRESGGHVGPLLSLVLWEKQIYRLLKEDNQSLFSIFFAGGIHDELSSAFVSIMAATLAAKGMKIGVLMGTSYLYTKEAIESGAILEEYQKQLIEKDETVLLEAAPGQETRSVRSEFTQFFADEKKRLLSLNLDPKEVWLRLEELNIGRTRIAAKGTERQGDKIVALTHEEQLEKGLYMTGQVTTLIKKPTTIDELHTSVAVNSNKLISELKEIPMPEYKAKPLDVAIVGMACVYPGAKNIEEYWKNILLGKDSVTEVPDSRWNKELFYNPNTRDTDFVSSKWGGFIPTIDFDPLEFGIPPQSLASIEPVQLLSLLVAKRALSDAGYDNLATVDLEDTSVIFGAEGATELASSYGLRAMAKQVFGELPEEVKSALPRLNEDSFAGVLSNVISGRIANRLNLGGRNYTVDAACASSLAALDLGCQELYNNKADMVLLGGADFHNGVTDYLMFSCTHALSKKGFCASFDAESDGISLGEGIGVLILKRLEDAERDGNKIYSVIKGVGGSSDGKSLGMTAPNRRGQTKALERAYQNAGILPSQVGLVEAHGTGTVVGDRTELSALTDAFLNSGATAGQTYLGSVKTQIGHTKCAAGIAGVMKAALSIYYGIQPPTIHLKKPNSFYNSETSPFIFNKHAGLWNSDRRIAGVSSFGFGGTNFHTVMESYKPEVLAETSMPSWPSELFVFRGDNLNEALEVAQSVKTLLSLNDEIPLKNIAYSLAIRNTKEIQLSIVAGSVEQLLDKIDAAKEDKKETGIHYRATKEGKVAFLFSGQGSQRVNMARDLFVAFPAMRNLLLKNKEYEKIMFPEAIFDDKLNKEQQKKITDTRNAQPVLGIVDLAIADFLRSLGIEPEMVAGHSYGELPALSFAGVISPDDLVPLSRKRAESILNAVGDDKGTMVAVNMPQKELEDLLKGQSEVWIVNYNSNKQLVLAGSTEGMKAFTQKMTQNNIAYKEINVACAFHSPLLNKAKGLYAEVLKNTSLNAPKVEMWSNTTALPYPQTADEIKERLSDHLIKPVLFSEQIENMFNNGARIFIETGPGRVLTGLVQSILGNEIVAIQTEGKDNEGVTFILQAIAKYISTGKKMNFEKLFAGRNVSTVDLDAPDQYKKKATIWHINGHYAAPTVGKMPADGALPITKPFVLNNVTMSNNTSPDQIMLEYLHGMKVMMQSQRDVMLGYLGQNQAISSPQSISIDAPQVAVAQQQIQASASVSNTQATTTVAQPTATVSANITNYTPEQLKNMLLEVVSDKTGYPTDMLGMDMDLEADLSIDSIKRMEIIGALREKLNISGGIEESEGAIEKMASIKTLTGLVAWLGELTDPSANTVTIKEATKTEDANKTEDKSEELSTPVDLARMRFELTAYPINENRILDIKNMRFALTDDGDDTTYSADIKNALEAKGAIVDIISPQDSLTEYDGLIVVNSSKSSAYYTIRDLFHMIKTANMERLKWIYTFSDLMASVSEENGTGEMKRIQGFPGLIKSLGREYPEINCRATVFHTLFDKNTLPQIVLNELSHADDSFEIIYNGDNRLHYHAVAESLSLNEPSTLSLDKDAVVLVYGGAQGITPELISQLAVEYPCNYILIGRSPMPTDENNKYNTLKTREEIRKYLIHEEQMKVPAEIEERVQHIFKANQITEAIEKINQSGAKAVYESLDIKDAEKTKALIKDIYAKYGRIDGIIHAAGVLDDKLFANKSLESFEQVYSTKVNPLHVILEEILPNVKLIVMFSSIASAYGNKGQTDYAAANSVFDLTTWALNKKTDAKVLTINWGPWKGAGMVSSALENEFEKRGVSLIPLKEGGAYFVNELKYGKDSQVLIVGNSEGVENFLGQQKN